MNQNSQFFLGLIIAASLLAGCLSGPLPEDIPRTTAPPTQPPLPLEDLTFVTFDSISYTIDPEFSDIFPKLKGLEFLPHLSSVDVMTNDLTVLDHPRRLQILASISGKMSGVYAKPKRDTDILVYYTVYKLNDTEIAADILESYKGAWNKRLLNNSGAEVWIWDGYLDEMVGSAPFMRKDSLLYWDAQSQVSVLSKDVRTDYPVLSKTETALYSIHGETVYKEYFIMIDIKADLEDIQAKTDSIFSQALTQIFKNTSPSNQPEPAVQPGENASSEHIDIKDELRLLLESYLAGNISKDEYDNAFEEYNSKLAK